MAMTYDQYQNRRSWLVDTAETPADKKKLAGDLAKLDAEWRAAKAAQAAKGTQADHHVTDNNSHTTPLKSQGAIAEDTLKKDVAAGKVTDLTKERQTIAKKTGVWPNGYTN